MARNATIKIEKTVPVKVTRRLYEAVESACRDPRTTPPAKFGPALAPWAKKLLVRALARAGAGKIAEVVISEDAEVPRRDATLRLPRPVVKQLGIVSSITGHTVSQMVEEKLWQLLSTK